MLPSWEKNSTKGFESCIVRVTNYKNMETEKAPNAIPSEEERIIFRFESARAAIAVNHERKSVYIADLFSGEQSQGHGSALLNELKKKYSDYEISLIADPGVITESPQPVSFEDKERAYELGWDFTKGKLHDTGQVLTQEEREFVERVGAEEERFRKESNPWMRLHAFYTKNGFEMESGGGSFVSKPPHKLIDLK